MNTHAVIDLPTSNVASSVPRNHRMCHVDAFFESKQKRSVWDRRLESPTSFDPRRRSMLAAVPTCVFCRTGGGGPFPPDGAVFFWENGLPLRKES